MGTNNNWSDLFYYDGYDLFWKTQKTNRPSKDGKAGYYNDQGYRIVMVNGKNYRTHRIIFEMIYGYEPEVIDHINGDTKDNRIENLRDCSHKQNLENTLVYSNNLTGFKGVRKHGDRYTAQITHNYYQHYLGMYDTPEEAHQAYLEARSLLFDTPNRC